MDDEVVVEIKGEKIKYTLEDIPPDLAKIVMDYQDACNLSGLIHAFSGIIAKLWERWTKWFLGSRC